MYEGQKDTEADRLIKTEKELTGKLDIDTYRHICERVGGQDFDVKLNGWL